MSPESQGEKTYRLLQSVQCVHLRSGFQESLRLGQTQTAAGAGDADHLAGETELGHASLLAQEDRLLRGHGGGGDISGFNGDRHCVV